MTRSTQPETRNPLLNLPAAVKMQGLPSSSKAMLRELLLELARDCRERADKCWRTHKPPMAAYWKMNAVYAGHLARLLK